MSGEFGRLKTSTGARGRAVLIAGPTASGKSALALERALAMRAVIVNADALQVYDGLRVLTARPSAEEVGEVPHRLYGFVSPTVRFSTGAWARAARDEIDKLDGRAAVFVGGTGLYFEALTKGFAEVPEVPGEVLARVSAEVGDLDRAERAGLLAARDPAMAARLTSADPQRVARALAVLEATGRSLASFHDEAQPALLEGFEFERLVLNPERDLLRQRIAARFEAMLQQGAVEEVRALLALRLDTALPAMKAIGVREIGKWLAGEWTREQAIAAAVIATHQYAKRQRTWFRGRMADWTWLA